MLHVKLKGARSYRYTFPSGKNMHFRMGHVYRIDFADGYSDADIRTVRAQTQMFEEVDEHGNPPAQAGGPPPGARTYTTGGRSTSPYPPEVQRALGQPNPAEGSAPDPLAPAVGEERIVSSVAQEKGKDDASNTSNPVTESTKDDDAGDDDSGDDAGDTTATEESASADQSRATKKKSRKKKTSSRRKKTDETQESSDS